MKYRMSEGLTNIGTPLKEALERTPRPTTPFGLPLPWDAPAPRPDGIRKDYEDEAFDDIEKAQQRKVAHGVTDGNKKDAALRLAREALQTPWNEPYVDGCDLALGMRVKAIKAIDEALGDV
jgi:hypothetical protein